MTGLRDDIDITSTSNKQEMVFKVPSAISSLLQTNKCDLARSSSPMFVPRKRSYQRNSFKNTQLVKKINKEEDEYDVAGKMVAFHLRAMKPNQRLMAEKLVSEIMFSGRMGNLSAKSKFLESTSSQASDTTVYLPSQSLESVILSNENEESISSIFIKNESIGNVIQVPKEEI